MRSDFFLKQFNTSKHYLSPFMEEMYSELILRKTIFDNFGKSGQNNSTSKQQKDSQVGKDNFRKIQILYYQQVASPYLHYKGEFKSKKVK